MKLQRIGSLGSGLGWFYGEGPGPGIRAIIRGRHGAEGTMGVFTKCAVKLYPWPGPKVLPVEGKAPAYRANLPENFAAYTLAFPNWQAYSDAAHKIWDAGIGYAIHRQFPLFGRDLKAAMLRIVSDHTKTLDDLENMVNIDEIKKRMPKESTTSRLWWRV